MTSAGIVLAGGRSTRMGRPKATLEWHGSTLLRRTVGILGRAVDGPVVVVRGAGQELPALPPDIELAEDERAGRSPLQGLAAGLAAVGARADAAFVCGADAPLLHPAVVRCVVAALRDGDDVALPRAHGHVQPLAAAYRVTVAHRVEELLRADVLSARALLERCRVRTLDEAALLADPTVAALDPALESLTNVNDAAQYEAARARPAPLVAVSGRGAIRAATLAGAGGGPATVAGRRVSDPEEPLVAGDVVTFEERRGARSARDSWGSL
ncbi:MAG TPA: molybdenum cofactor guanylyltransferase [Solirubrobacteraceae bacterium]|nr:molybdenum cofactor guanylyltransferase [Solirubrobacteraceae bacterium]